MNTAAYKTTDCVVFDHDAGTMHVQAVGLGFLPVPVGQNEDSKACEWLLNPGNDWKIAFVHIHDLEWAKLVAGVPQGKTLVRFSSAGFSPFPLEKGDPLCLRCLGKTGELKATEEQNDIENLVRVLKSADRVKLLKEGDRVHFSGPVHELVLGHG